MNWTLIKRIFPYPPTFGQNLVLLLVSLAGVIVFFTHDLMSSGVSLRSGAALALLAGLSAATGMLIYQERRSWRLLQELRSALAKIAPAYARLTATRDLRSGTETLEREIRTLTERWQEFCGHCQRAHENEMLQAEHLATIGELAAGIAHEIRNPLAGIAGAIEIITRDFPPDHPDREILEDLRQEVRRIEKTLNDLLVYARPKPPQFGPTDLRETVAHTLQLANRQTGTKRVEFSIQLPPSLPQFQADSEQLHQVLLNLILNGIQAIEREGKIGVTAEIRGGAASDGNRALEISVSDTGPGIPPEHRDRIFRPFYTTKRSGTGLGLSLCRRIINQHGGTLSVESELGKGTRFIIHLPLRASVTEAREAYVR